ncbi:MAG: box helicase domain protein, partial [Defluviitaleaceae bacterium]|nr:box helicase domain protein [Defluviitaleaceae bacterium]
METVRFEELNISEELNRAIRDMGFEETTPIQAQAIPHILEGKDVIGQAQTGTGKTASFGIPILEMVDPQDQNLQALVLCPTRELAIQVAEEIRKLGKYLQGIKLLPIYGGQPIERQIRSLKKGVQIIIGTPGRVMDHMRRKTLKLDKVKMVVLDEADEMLNMGFREDIETILKDTPKTRQTVLFSATMPKEILEIAKAHQNNPEIVKVVHKELTVPSIEQYYFEVKEKNKFEILTRLIDMYNPKLALIFCNTKKKVDELKGLIKEANDSYASLSVLLTDLNKIAYEIDKDSNVSINPEKEQEHNIELKENEKNSSEVTNSKNTNDVSSTNNDSNDVPTF